MNQAMGSGDDYDIKDPEEHSRGEAWQGKAGYDRRRPPDSVPCPVAMPAHQPACLLVVPIPDCRACSFLRPPSVDSKSKFLSLDPVFPFPPAPRGRGRVPCVYLSASSVASFGDWVSQCGTPARAATALNGLEVPARGPAVVQHTSNAR